MKIDLGLSILIRFMRSIRYTAERDGFCETAKSVLIRFMRSIRYTPETNEGSWTSWRRVLIRFMRSIRYTLNKLSRYHRQG